MGGIVSELKSKYSQTAGHNIFTLRKVSRLEEGHGEKPSEGQNLKLAVGLECKFRLDTLSQSVQSFLVTKFLDDKNLHVMSLKHTHRANFPRIPLTVSSIYAQLLLVLEPSSRWLPPIRHVWFGG